MNTSKDIQEPQGNNANRVLVTGLEYFGTDLQSAGHYFWQLSGDHFRRSYRNFSETPFNPEGLTNGLNNGEMRIEKAFGYNICAIAGSPKDTRGGCKSVFFTTEDVENWKDVIESIPIAKKIIEQMPFKVKWTKACH